MSEKQEQQAIVQLLRSVGAEVYVLGHPRRRGDHPGTGQTPGLADLEAYVPHYARTTWTLVKIEVKTPTGRLSEAQQTYRFQCLRAGVAYVCGGLDAVLEYLEGRGLVKRSA